MERPESIYGMRGIRPWHDHGNILINGFLADIHVPGQYELIRTGPFVPPVTFASLECVITDSVKIDLEHTDFKGYEFAEAPLGKVVESSWDTWDLSQELDYSKLPDGEEFNEPEDLILAPPHRPDLAEKMPKLWFLRGVSVKIESGSYSPESQTLSWNNSEVNGWDVFFLGDGIRVYLSKRAKEWFMARYGIWLEMEQIAIVD